MTVAAAGPLASRQLGDLVNGGGALTLSFLFLGPPAVFGRVTAVAVGAGMAVPALSEMALISVEIEAGELC